MALFAAESKEAVAGSMKNMLSQGLIAADSCPPGNISMTSQDPESVNRRKPTMTESLVLVPGLLCTRALWEPQIAALGDVADMVVADHTRHDPLAAIARSILAQAPERFALAGLSMGGIIAFEIVRQAPARVTRLALLDTNARPETPERSEQRRALIALAEREGARKAQEALLGVLIHKDRLGDKGLVETVLRMGEDTGTEAFKRQQAAIMSRPDSRPTLAGIGVPTLVLVGREDVLTPIELSQEMADAIPGARLEVVEACGHLSTLERPEAVNRALRRWLAA
jgi:pimeloyl-ACP methyl ester carboxylesterase